MLEPQLLPHIVMWLVASSGGVHLAHVQISTAIHISDCLVLHCFQAVILGYIQLMYRFPIGHRCRCVCFLLILYRYNVANTFTCVPSTIHNVFVSDIVSKWMREGEKKVSELFKWAPDEAPTITLLTKLTPYVVHGVITMRMKHLDESKQNFLYRCSYFVSPGNRLE